MRAALRKEKSWILVAVGLMAMGCFGFAMLGFVSQPQTDVILDSSEEIVVLDELELPAELDSNEFWQTRGFLVADYGESQKIYVEQIQEQVIQWKQKTETWILVPQEFTQTLYEGVTELVRILLENDYEVQLEQDEMGFTLGAISQLPGTNQKVMGRVWRLEMLNPTNHARYRLNYVPLLGGREWYDPQAGRRGTPQSPVMAVIIDDWGYDSQAVEPLLNYPFPLTLAILPHLPRSAYSAERGLERGHHIILHQPMEPLDSLQDPGPGAVRLSMTDQEIVDQIMDNLQSLPMAVGMNNHMGSKATSDKRVMGQVLGVLHDAGLFFIDSYTSPTSVAAHTAEALGVPYAVNDLFIDNSNDVDEIMAQIRRGLNLAKRNGQAIIIGHVRPRTASALWRMIPEIMDSGVELVPVSTLLVTPARD